MSESQERKPLPRFAQLLILLGIILIAVRLGLWHVHFDKADKADQKFLEKREAVTGMHCANDRSRWSTVVALVHYGTFAIDEIDRLRGADGNWGTIDKVYHFDSSGTERFYSSKPPLYNLLLAAQYWLVNKTTGLHILERPLTVIKLLTFINQSLLFITIVILLARVAKPLLTDNRLYALYLIAIIFGTFLSTFAVTINNHIPAALFSLLTVLQCRKLTTRPHYSPGYAYVGFYAAITVTFELPALAFLGLIGIWCLALDYKRALLFGLPAILAIATAYLGVNKLAHDSWRPPYAHRSDGDVVEVLSFDDGNSLIQGKLPDNLDLFSETMPGMGNYRIEDHPTEGRWRVFDFSNNVRYALVRRESTYEIRTWDNWYDYEVNGRKSYWLPGEAAGVDLGESSRITYLFHLVIGHHGFFSLTPIFIFAIFAMIGQLKVSDSFWKPLAQITLTLTAVLLIFYTMRPIQDRNYGGVASGFRWMFWLVPSYCLFFAHGILRARRSFFLLILLMLAILISIYSAHHAFLNPWQNPWPYHD